MVSTYRQIATIERMDDKGFVADVDNTADSAACAEGGHRSRIVFDRSVIVAMFNFLSSSWMDIDSVLRIYHHRVSSYMFISTMVTDMNAAFDLHLFPQGMSYNSIVLFFLVVV